MDDPAAANVPAEQVPDAALSPTAPQYDPAAHAEQALWPEADW